MSTVLTNGIIIPDNGSRNWGGDLANNWNILDAHVSYMTDVKNRVTTLENSVAENTANIQNNASNISALQTSKQDVIEDLETIRAGASAGATAVQQSELNAYYTKPEVDTALTNKANTSDLSNFLPLGGGAIVGNITNHSNSNGWKPGFEWLYNNERFAYIHPLIDEAKGEKSLYIQANTNVSLLSQELIFSISRTDSGNTYHNALIFQCKTDGTFNFYSKTPANLGTSANKWKSLNGINIGALSLANCAESVEVTSQIVDNNGQFQYTNNLYDGWLVVTAFADNVRISNQGFECRAVKSIDDAVTTHIALRLNETVYMNFTNFTNFAYVKLYKCAGNV